MRTIMSMENQHVKLAASLKQHKYRQQYGMFLVEGRRSVTEAKGRLDLVESVFIDKQLLQEREILSGFEPGQVYVTEARIMRHICSTEHPQGIAAILRNPVWDWQALLNRRGKMLFMDRIADPGNMGSILRSSWAFNIDGILLGRSCVDPHSPKVVRASMGAVLNVPIFIDVTSQQLDEVEQKGYKLWATDVAQGRLYDQADWAAPLLLIIGSEAEGVSDMLKQRCQEFINIPINPQVESLNVAAACAIIIAEIARQSRSSV